MVGPTLLMVKTLTRSAVRAPSEAPISTQTVSRESRPDGLLPTIVRILEDAKAEETVTIDLVGKTSLADAMVVTTGRSNRHVSAIADQVIEELKTQG